AGLGQPGAGGAPPGSEEEMSRLLAMAEVPEEELNPFQVLGLEATASDAELKKAYRRLAVLVRAGGAVGSGCPPTLGCGAEVSASSQVHPDKNRHPRAEAAFKVLRAAWDIVSSPERRKEYEMKRMAESELTKSMSEFLSRLQDDLKEAMNTMMCSKCQGKHKRFELDRDPLSARYCAECGALHPAEEGDFWADPLPAPPAIPPLQGGQRGRWHHVFLLAEWAGCQRVGISPDTHRVPYHISFGARNAGPAGRQRS
ncbi:DJC14 protein, partial [Thinocorus orbignyianus]|nr:DJC14 protein [Thinocorus orbignyianus]